MKKSFDLFWLICLGGALLFDLLIRNYEPGLNYVVYSLALLGLFYFYLKPEKVHRSMAGMIAFLILATAAVVFVHTAYSIFIYWLFTLVFCACAGYSELRHWQLIPLGIVNNLENLMKNKPRPGRVKSGGRTGAILRFVFLPLFTVLILLMIYGSANPHFAKSISWLTETLRDFLREISVERLVFLFLGFVLTAMLVRQYPLESVAKAEAGITHEMVRRREKRKSPVGGLSKLLLRKKQVAVVSFLILNVMIAWLNYLDIQFIWINFNWDGGFLKEMVHEGTYLLIGALLISGGITVFYLNSNLVFFKNNGFFNGLLIAWLIQNLFMAASVALRNSIYIEHFSLAYKRIFVFFFLAACCVGLLSMIYKIVFRRSVDFLGTVNSVSLMIILLTGALFNWDKIIARYNFSHYEQGFVHYEFLMGLNNSALPCLIKSREELEKIQQSQVQKFGFIRSREFEQLDYINRIENRKAGFMREWESRSFWEWNYPEYRAYQLLKDGLAPK